MTKSMDFTVSTWVPASPGEVYAAWLNSATHSEMTGGAAQIGGSDGGEFVAWDGYIRGRNLELVADERIVQAWRTTEFSDDEEDSRLEIVLSAERDGTRVTLNHTNLPAHGEQYIKGWEDFYFVPMQTYFSTRRG